MTEGFKTIAFYALPCLSAISPLVLLRFYDTKTERVIIWRFSIFYGTAIILGTLASKLLLPNEFLLAPVGPLAALAIIFIALPYLRRLLLPDVKIILITVFVLYMIGIMSDLKPLYSSKLFHAETVAPRIAGLPTNDIRQ